MVTEIYDPDSLLGGADSIIVMLCRLYDRLSQNGMQAHSSTLQQLS